MPKVKSCPSQTLSPTELGWIVQALNHEIVTYRIEIEETDSDVVKNLGYLAIETRTNLVTKLTDLINSNAKRVEIA